MRPGSGEAPIIEGHIFIYSSSYTMKQSISKEINCAEHRDYFMVGECVRFLFTSCEGSLNERVSAANE